MDANRQHNAGGEIKRRRIFIAGGDFNCQQVVGCALLKLHPLFKNAQIFRTSDLLSLTPEDAVIDHGDYHDPDSFKFNVAYSTGTFASFNGGRGPKLPLSSAGMIYCYHGKDILRSLANQKIDDCIYTLYEKVYESFVVEIDALAHGYPIGASPMNSPVYTRYRICTDLSTRVNRLNILGRREGYTCDGLDAFDKAIQLAQVEFRDRVDYYINVWGPARELVKQAIQTRKSVHHSGEIIQMAGGCPWGEHLVSLEVELNVGVPIKFVVYEDTRVHDWRVQAVPVAPKSFELRQGLKAEWRGLRGKQLDEPVGVPGAVFVHASGFIGGHSTREGALEMAIRSLSQ